MTRYKHSRLIDALCISALLGASASSCSKQEEVDVSPLLSDTEITLSLSEWTPIVQSRATTLFDKEDDLKDEKKGGGNFTLYSYVDDATATKYINGVQTWYFGENSEWVMLDGNNKPITYYWPNSEKLNFFAFMPYNNNNDEMSEKTHVEVLDYSKEKGAQFRCDLPNTASNTADEGIEMQEFIYAYEPEKTKQGQYNSETKQYDPLELHFKHPFALINFKLKSGSYRMTVNEITFNNICLNGTFSTASGEWEHGDKQLYTAKIDKRVPNDINYNTVLSDGFIVMPQDLNGVKLTLHATRASDKANPTEETKIEKTYTFSNSESKEWKWEPGQKYTYVISYGDNKEEIYFNVTVEEWTEIEYEHNIDVE